MRHQQVGAEAARLVDEALELDGGLLGSADHGEAGLDEDVGDGLDAGDPLGGEGQGRHPLEVVDPLGQAVVDVGPGLLLGGRHVHGPDQPPRRPVGGGAELRRSLLDDLPVLAEHVEALDEGRRQ